ncbi:MAG: hypothetical protein PHY31_09605 [Smithellaceae bacterium]|nr:hypothetical protein [Smithellaceae bacterium]
MKKMFVACTFVFLLAGLAAPAGAFEIGARGYLWFPTFNADMRVDTGSVQGTVQNMKDQLGVGYKYVPSVEAYAGIGKNHLSLMYTPIDYDGDTNTTATITFDGQTFGPGNVETDLNMQMLDLEYKIDMIDFENLLAGFSLSAIGQIKYMDGSLKMKSGSTEAEKTFQLPVPMVGLGAHIGILANILEARAKVAGIGWSDNYFVEALGDISWTPFPFLDLNAGYRHIALKIDYKDVYLDSAFTGPYVALTVGF